MGVVGRGQAALRWGGEGPEGNENDGGEDGGCCDGGDEVESEIVAMVDGDGLEDDDGDGDEDGFHLDQKRECRLH